MKRFLYGLGVEWKPGGPTGSTSPAIRAQPVFVEDCLLFRLACIVPIVGQRHILDVIPFYFLTQPACLLR